MIGVDLKSAFFGAQLRARQMIKQGGGGHIINISSVHEEWPMPGNIAYCCAKGRGAHVDPYRRRRVGSVRHHGGQCWAWRVDTPIDAATLADPVQRARLDAAIPQGRVAEPDEIANLVVWLASNQASYATATTYFVDGGIMQGSVGL